MAQTQRAQGPSDPEATGGPLSDAPESFGNGGLVGDGRYRLTHRLGRGGMAEVWAAEDVRLGRTVAVKLLRADLAEDPVSKARFTREAQSVAGLNHHAVVAVYDSGEDTVGGNVVPYIVMELVEGRTIRELLLSAEAPTADQALIIVSGVLDALAYSHQHGIVHRDIKPANVIITHSGAVKVMDFGIARALHGAQSTMTQTGMVMGTPQYLSPEQALGKAVDHRSDLYATGCLLYELLASRPPFTGETPLSVVYQHVQDPPVPPSQMAENCPPELDGLVLRALAKEPDDRFQSAEEMSGLVQYALQMLHDQGAFTGTWNTGQVDPAAFAAGAMAAGPATTPFGSGTAQIPQQPMLRPLGEDDGGYEGGGGSQRGGSRTRLYVVAALALVAIVVGAAFAIPKIGGDSSGDTDKKPQPTVSQSEKKEKKSTEPTKSTEEDQGGGTETGSGTGSGNGWGQDRPSQGGNQQSPPTPSTTDEAPPGGGDPQPSNSQGEGGTDPGNGQNTKDPGDGQQSQPTDPGDDGGQGGEDPGDGTSTGGGEPGGGESAGGGV
ncbi:MULTISPECIES: protein kinase [unclassified Streptomyces]|uniref:protein kinase domain-containing protein n=1 Tax=unclassified Streptomyces TaxID=2593676 RepID=UPI0001B53E67|nr:MULTISPECIES: protein kinase [unclassified Streptomyces]EFL01268.1 serine/threonine protein kinase [Streptomyces sp. SPB78]MYR28609.1 protein kinase [Streptomyces sp. SID4945]SCD63628.1 Serine/threonine protein kinase [Streptomyces sp. TverLS-915]SCF39531.1 Serine/threonine protein kinase [Streptomyces sp. LcepLS]